MGPRLVFQRECPHIINAAIGQGIPVFMPQTRIDGCIPFQHNGGGSGGKRRHGAGGGVLESDTIARVDSQFVSGLEIGIGERFSAGNPVTGDHSGKQPAGLSDDFGKREI